jgi:N6-L-threonylcarbamoyladenine synthase
VRYLLPKLPAGTRTEDLCASFQDAVVDVLIAKALAAARTAGRKWIALSGGVSCNSRLREKMQEACRKSGLGFLIADPKLCTDNAAMIAFVALHRLREKSFSSLTADIDPNLRLV